MVKTISQRKVDLINRVFDHYGDDAKLLVFNKVDESRLALWYLRYLREMLLYEFRHEATLTESPIVCRNIRL